MASIGTNCAVLAIVFGGLTAGSAGVRAQACNVSLTAMNFGTVNRARGPFETTANLAVSCTGQSHQTILLCPQLTANTGGQPGGQLAHVSDASQRVQVALYADPGHTVPWSDGLNVTLNAGGSGSERRTIYGRMFPAQGAKGGRYQASLAMAFTASYVGAGPACAAGTLAPRAPAPPTIAKPIINRKF